jgi:hypothetical protein
MSTQIWRPEIGDKVKMFHDLDGTVISHPDNTYDWYLEQWQVVVRVEGEERTIFIEEEDSGTWVEVT